MVTLGELAEIAVRTGDPQDIERFLSHPWFDNLGRYYARRYRGQTLYDAEDLAQEARIAAWKALVGYRWICPRCRWSFISEVSYRSHGCGDVEPSVSVGKRARYLAGAKTKDRIKTQIVAKRKQPETTTEVEATVGDHSVLVQRLIDSARIVEDFDELGRQVLVEWLAGRRGSKTIANVLGCGRETVDHWLLTIRREFAPAFTL